MTTPLFRLTMTLASPFILAGVLAVGALTVVVITLVLAPAVLVLGVVQVVGLVR